jgi:hypothetical protein
VVVHVHLTPVSVDVDRGRGGSVDPVVLAAAATGEPTDAAGRRGRNVDDALPADDEPLSQVAAEPVGVLHHPPVLRPAAAPGQETPVLRQARLDPQRTRLLIRGRVNGGSGVSGLVWVNTDHDQGSSFLTAGRQDVHGRYADFRNRWPGHASVESDRGRTPGRRHTPSRPTPRAAGTSRAIQPSALRNATSGQRVCTVSGSGSHSVVRIVAMVTDGEGGRSKGHTRGCQAAFSSRIRRQRPSVSCALRAWADVTHGYHRM